MLGIHDCSDYKGTQGNTPALGPLKTLKQLIFHTGGKKVIQI